MLQHRIKKQKQWLWIFVIVAIAISRVCWYIVQKPYATTNDSPEYISFDSLEVLRGNLSATLGRPPLYGFFLDLMEFAFGTNYLIAVKFVQILVSLLSIFLFSRILRRLGVSSPWKEICVLLYGVSPAVVGWDNMILTESFSLSGVIVFFYWIVLYIQEHRLRYGVLAHLMAVILIFLRPQFLVYLALLLAFLFLKILFPANQEERKKIITLLILQFFLWAAILGYCALFQHEFGVFSLTTTSARQDLKICIDREYYLEFDDKEVSDFIANSMAEQQDAWKACEDTIAKYGRDKINRVTSKFFEDHLARYVSDTFGVMADDMKTYFCGYGLENYNVVSESGTLPPVYSIQIGLFQYITVGHALLASVLEGIAMVIIWVRSRKIPWIHTALFSISACSTFLTYFITCGEYMRTMISIVPYLYCLMAMFLQFCASYFSKKVKNM